MSRPDHTLAREFEAALAWWQAAGVDCDFSDDATTWLADRAAADAPAGRDGEMGPAAGMRKGAGAERARQPLALVEPAPPAPRPDLLGESPPADLAAFRRWWMEAPELGPQASFPRIAPRGEAGAALMVLVPQPEAEDRERLLSGPQGRLLAAILAAIGLEESAVYIAAALPAHRPMADLPGMAAAGMDAVTAHHVALVAPARLLAFGTGLAPMLGAAPDEPLREFNRAGLRVPAMVSEALDALMDMPRLKARFWRRWMEWSATH